MKNFLFARIAGGALILTAVVLLFVNPKAENNLPKGFFTPIIALEFVQTPQEITHFFEVQDTAAYEQHLLLGNKIDYLFMCLYSALLFFIALHIYQTTASKTMYAVIVLCGTMLLGDALENVQLFQLIQSHSSADMTPYLHKLHFFTWLKWGSIAITFSLFATTFMKGNRFHRLIGSACMIAFFSGVAAFVQHGILNELFATCVVIVFLLLVIYVFVNKPIPPTSLQFQH